MAALHTTNRAMFWRIIRRLFGANPGRLFVMLLALGAGAAVTAALLNLQIDAKRRLTTEFRAFGANVYIGPRETNGGTKLLSESLYGEIPARSEMGEVSKAAFLFGVVEVENPAVKGQKVKAVLVGYEHWYVHPERVISTALAQYERDSNFLSSDAHCAVGQRLASALRLKAGDEVRIIGGAASDSDSTFLLPSTGGPEDDQVFIYLYKAQSLFGHPKSVSQIQINVPGDSYQIQQYIENLQDKLPEVEGHPIRQFTEAQAKIYSRISGVLNYTVALVLILTALCVMAAMTNVAMERKMDVGLMKAIGGSVRRVLRLFLVESALLGLVGGVIGAALGIFLSIGLGKAVFGVAARPRLIVYPVAVALTVIVSIAGAFPLRRLASIRPASVFRGEA